MDNILKKYFSDIPAKDDYAGKNIFYPPATPDRISQVEEALSVKFPPDYITFLQATNGYDGKLGKSYSVFIQLDKIEEYTKGYGGELFPWIIFIGGDGGNEMYVIDKRKEILQFGVLPFIGEESDFIPLGETFEGFIRHLYHQDFWPITSKDEHEEKKGNERGFSAMQADP